MKKDMVSIVVPVYNSAKFLNDTIKTVQEQTYSNWELIFVDDGSMDDSVEIIKSFQKSDKRIKLFEQQKNYGAALARNKGINESQGNYLCYIDADDLWDKEKLEKQVKFMKENNCEFSFTGYEFADEKGIPNGSKVFIPKKIDYNHALRNTTIWTSTVMFDLNRLSKNDIYMPNVKSEDTACWWKILRKIKYAYGLNEILSYYRRTAGTLSSNKFEAIKRIWHLYRKQEKLNIFKSSFCFCGYAINAVRRRI